MFWLLAAILLAQEVPGTTTGDPLVTLRIDYATPPGKENLWFAVREPDIDTCLADAKEALLRGVPQLIQDRYDVHAMAATCAIPAVREQQS